MVKKILIITGIIIVIALVGGYFYAMSIAKSGQPDYNQNIKLEGLKNEVTVYRDKYGIAHVYAKTKEDLYLAVGYISAQDRMWQMDLLRRVTSGRLSEIFGEDMIENDMVLRALRIPENSQKIIEKSSPEIMLALNAYAKGVNQYIEDNKDNLPFEFRILGYQPEKWEPVHSVSMVGYMGWSLKVGWKSEILMQKLKGKVSQEKLNDLFILDSRTKHPAFQDYSITDTLTAANMFSDLDKIQKIAPPASRASNNWAVAGKKSTTGMPILANDMHLGLSVPGVWTQIHEHSDDGIDVTGVMLPGQPFVVAGHNKNIAWGMTNVMLDNIDFYVETINPENKNQYKFNGKWKDMIVKKEEIKISNDKTITKELRFTHRGPVISGFKNITDKVISMRWTGNEFSNEVKGVYLLNLASNIKEFRAACSEFGGVAQNIIYSDIKGNIGLQMSAYVPKRKAPGNVIFPGDTDEYDWKGKVPFDSLPHIFNPKSGYVYSANFAPVDSTYPYYLSSGYYVPLRGDRIREMLTEKEKLSPEDFKLMQNDQHSLFVKKFIPKIIKALKKVNNLTKPEKLAFDLLKKWDYNMTAKGAQSLIFEKFNLILTKNIASDEVGKDLMKDFLNSTIQISYLYNNILKNGNSDWCDDVNTKNKKENFADMIVKSYKETIKQLSDELGDNPEKWAWGKVHKLTLNHPIGKVKILNFLFNLNREYQVGGAKHTVSPYTYNYNEPFNSSTGASHRHIYNLADFDKSFSIIPTGVSGIPTSPHYCDQSELYVKGIYHADYTSKDKVKNNAKYTMKFTAK